MSHWSPQQRRQMRRVLQLARRGRGRVSPNPMVGAIVVKGDRIVGEGFHVFKARDHAELIALRQAGKEARGGDLYINLEPCSHEGRTPPCCESIVRAGIKRVFFSTRDPNPLVSGRGSRWLKAAGIEVEEGLLAERAEVLNEVFFHYIRRRRPFLLLKLALTLDGKIAAPGGDSQWITGVSSRRRVHRLRQEMDAVLVGIGTVLADDPSLDVRLRGRSPILKIVLDSNLRLSPRAQLFQSGDPVIVFHSHSAPDDNRRALGSQAELIPVDREVTGLWWEPILEVLGRRQVTGLLVEGGARVAATALASRVVQKLAFFYGPKILGNEGLSGIGSLAISSLKDAVELKQLQVRRFAQDFLVQAYLERDI